MDFKKINIEINSYKDKFSKIKLDQEWNIIIANKNILFEAISNLIFKIENIYFYLTSLNSSKTWEEVKKFCSELKSNKIICDEHIIPIFSSVGWLCNEKELNTESKQVQGDLGEYIMHIFVDYLELSKTLVSKISFKTSKGISVYGDDGIFFDYENKILYSAESKFWLSFKDALKKAVERYSSYKSISTLDFVRYKTSNIKGIDENDWEKKVEFFESIKNVHKTKIKFEQIFFIIEENCYLKKDIRKKIEELIREGFLNEKIIVSSIFVFFSYYF